MAGILLSPLLPRPGLHQFLKGEMGRRRLKGKHERGRGGRGAGVGWGGRGKEGGGAKEARWGGAEDKGESGRRSFLGATTCARYCGEDLGEGFGPGAGRALGARGPQTGWQGRRLGGWRSGHLLSARGPRLHDLMLSHNSYFTICVADFTPFRQFCRIPGS